MKPWPAAGAEKIQIIEFERGGRVAVFAGVVLNRSPLSDDELVNPLEIPVRLLAIVAGLVRKLTLIGDWISGPLDTLRVPAQKEPVSS